MDSDVQYAAARPSRDPAIDFYRGVSLLLIFYNHFVYLTDLRLRIHYGFSDAAAIFVFLSGYVGGMVYLTAAARGGFPSMARKAFKRVLQIYGAHVGTFAIVGILFFLLPVLSGGSHFHKHLETFGQNPLTTFFNYISLRYFPWYFDILPLYLLLVAALPLMITVLRRRPYVGLAISAGLYGLHRGLLLIGIGSPFDHWNFDPLAWQLLFFGGAFFSTGVGRSVIKALDSKILLVAASFILVYSFVDIGFIQRFQFIERIPFARTVLMNPYDFSKSLLDPIILLHFASLAYVTYKVTPRLLPLLGNRPAQAIVRCGQHSLTVFSMGIVLDYVFSYILDDMGGGVAPFLSLSVLGIAIQLVTAEVLSANKQRRLQTAKVVA